MIQPVSGSFAGSINEAIERLEEQLAEAKKRRNALIGQYYGDGTSKKELGRMFGLSDTAIRKILAAMVK